MLTTITMFNFEKNVVVVAAVVVAVVIAGKLF